jgi:hypothetical protein
MEVTSGRIIGTGEVADLVRGHDWNSTPLGPIEARSKELVTIVNLTLASSSAARTVWGPQLILIYNGAYRPIPGPRHPPALGKSAREVYCESWPVVEPLLEEALATGKTVFHEKLLVPLPTEDGVRDSYLNYSFNPIFEDGAIAVSSVRFTMSQARSLRFASWPRVKRELHEFCRASAMP